jgi:type VI secretion system secreted protein VgrG
MALSDERLQVMFESGEKMSVRRFAVQEGLSQLFRVEMFACSENEDVDLEAITGKAASFKITPGFLGAMPDRLWTGVCEMIEQVQPESKGLSTYHLIIVPQLWLLTKRINNRIYQHKTIPEIIESLLGEWQIQPSKNLKETYYKLEYVVQYGESDFVFFSRLLERAGITFYFAFQDGKVELRLNDPRKTIPSGLAAPSRRSTTPTRTLSSSS